MRLLRPESAVWWELVPLLVAFLAVQVLYARSVRRAAAAARFRPLSRRSTWKRYTAIGVFGLLAAGSLVFALQQPQALMTRSEPQYEREDLVLLLDRSESMRAHDIKPSRFSRAILEIRNFLQHKPDNIDRVGLVGFAGSSLILSYLTNDLDTVTFYLDWIGNDTETLLGTDIGAALKNGMQVAKKDDRRTKKIFVLISDGEDYGNELALQVAAYRDAGVRINCIGIGSDEEVPVPVIQPDGHEIPLRDDDGHVVFTKFEEGTLRQIASETGGRYIRSRTGNELATALADIERGERRIDGYRTTTEYRDLYPLALAVSGAAMAGLWLML
ncbi:MAG: vWA domain-containing protein [Vicinamibacterales bacterium]